MLKKAPKGYFDVISEQKNALSEHYRFKGKLFDYVYTVI
jgi:hypothetical protein